MNSVCQYFKLWRIKLNANKTVKMPVVGSYHVTKYKDRKNIREVEIRINTNNIQSESETKYLGIFFNQKLTFGRHLEHTLRKANTAYGMLANIFRNKNVNKEVKLLAYKTLIRPVISYGSVIWNQTSAYQHEIIRRKERTILRQCVGLYRNEDDRKYVNSSQLYKLANVDRIDCYCTIINLNIIQKINDNRDRPPCCNWVEWLRGDEHPNEHHHLPNRTWLLHENNELYEDGKLLIYNKKKINNELIYVLNQ